MTKSIIVARYNEPVKWVNLFSKDVTVYIYNKGEPIDILIDRAIIIPLPNLCREAHTYLFHLMNVAHDDRMAFLQGNPFDQCGRDAVSKVQKWLDADSGFESFCTLQCTIRKTDEGWEEKGNGWSSMHQIDDAMIMKAVEMFPDKIHDWQFGAGASFGVTAAEAAGLNYRPLFNYCKEVDSDPKHIHSHLMERIWKLIFT